MIIDSIFLLLVCYKSYEHYRSLPGTTWRSTRLMNVIVRDSLVYFFMYDLFSHTAQYFQLTYLRAPQ